MRPPRFLIAVPVTQETMRGWGEWVTSLSGQDAECLWDVLILDSTEDPHPWYVEGLNRWARSRPFGRGHKVRVIRYGRDVDGRRFTSDAFRRDWAWSLAWAKFTAWTSYDGGLVVMSPGSPMPAGLLAAMVTDRSLVAVHPASPEPVVRVAAEMVRAVPWQSTDEPIAALARRLLPTSRAITTP